MTTATLPQTPITITSRWVFPPILPCTRFPTGCPGCLEIAAPTKRGAIKSQYMVEVILDGAKIVGWELTHLDNGQVYAIDHLSWGWEGASCECASCVYRQRVCKHVLALHQSLKTIGVEQ